MTLRQDLIAEAVLALLEARHHDPFALLGRHPAGAGVVVRALLPGAVDVTILETGRNLSRTDLADFFEWRGSGEDLPAHYRLRWTDPWGNTHIDYDPYTFGPQVSDFDLHLFGEGKHWHAYRFLGANLYSADGIDGVLFAVWAPNAERVSVVGEFNAWDGRRHPMRARGGSGVWEIFIPGVAAGALYKLELRSRGSGRVEVKSDPYGREFEVRPKTAARVTASPSAFGWQDQEWLDRRAQDPWLHAPVSIYEVHLGSWRRGTNGAFLNYRELAHRLVDHVRTLGFTHIELLPLTEHPLDASWGYQALGYYAPTSRFGTPDDFRYFVDYCHRHQVGVLLDWVPGHFPTDPHGLARFDGTALYEHADPRRGEHRDWGTYIYNFGRNEVKNFLLASAVYWLEEFHIDGLRVDAVASMLYLDYSRKDGEWLPNVHGGRENLEAIDFLRELNAVTHERFPGTMTIAEESTAWPQVSRPVWLGGLGFSMKWNMGWMHDTLDYMTKDPIHRHYHHNHLTFGLLYAHAENFVLPFSHDEVVHGKRSIRYKMPGDEWQQFANLRLLYTYMYTYPGKKLLFMGAEFGQGGEWNHDAELDWYVRDYAPHCGLQNLVGDLNRIYREERSLHRYDFDAAGFEWIDCHDAAQSVITYMRKSDGDFLVVALNFTPVPRHGYRIGVPRPGLYTEALNSDSSHYGGSNVGNTGKVYAQSIPWMGQPYSLTLTLPPLAGVVFKPGTAS